MTNVVLADNHSKSDKLLYAGDSIVKRIMPVPQSDSQYVATDYTEIHFKLNSSYMDISYMENGLSLLHLDHVIDSIGKENITAIEIISQSSPEGSLKRNTELTRQRYDVIRNYMYRVYPDLKGRITMNSIIESWDNLAQYVAQDPNLEEATRNRILEIIESGKISNDSKKSLLKSSLGSNPRTGNVYAYLTKYYYPVIRNSGIYILHTVEPEPEFHQEPEKPSYQETEIQTVDTIAYIPEPIASPLAQSQTQTQTEQAQTEQPQAAQPQPADSVPPVQKRPFIAVKTNMLYNMFMKKDLGWAPIWNVEAELYPTQDGRWTWLMEYEFPWYSKPSKHQYLQVLNLQFEARRYFKAASAHTGHYLSAYAGINEFDICFDRTGGHGYQGEGGGLGLGYGYVMPLGKKPDTKWKLEFFVKGGFFMTYYDPYDAGSPFAGKYYYQWYDSPSLFVRRNMVFRWMGPTGAGITLSYDLIPKKIKDKNTK